MEKNGNILLTEEDLDKFRQGIVSDRVRDTWNLSYEDLKKYIENNNYKVI
jgi:hypothetical protein